MGGSMLETYFVLSRKPLPGMAQQKGALHLRMLELDMGEQPLVSNDILLTIPPIFPW